MTSLIGGELINHSRKRPFLSISIELTSYAREKFGAGVTRREGPRITDQTGTAHSAQGGWEQPHRSVVGKPSSACYDYRTTLSAYG